MKKEEGMGAPSIWGFDCKHKNLCVLSGEEDQRREESLSIVVFEKGKVREVFA